MYFLDYIAYRDLYGRVLGQFNKGNTFGVILVDQLVHGDNGEKIEILKSDTIKTFIEETYEGAVVPLF